MMKNIIRQLGIVFLLLVTACDLDGDLQNPNEISVSGADVDLLMNGVQLDFADFFNSASGGNVTTKVTVGTEQLMRMQAMTTGFRYQTAFLPQYLDFTWEQAYRYVLINIKNLKEIASEKELGTHVAVAKVLEAYVYLTLVDLFGDIPQSEALNAATGEFNPVPDGGADVYAYAISLLDEAQVELSKVGEDAALPLKRDVYYGGSSGTEDGRDNWFQLANTLELKAWLNVSMIAGRKAEADAKMADLLANADLIDQPSENFVYKYGTVTTPVSRHPLYEQYYTPSKGGATGYISNYYLYELFNGKGIEDPRWRYYFYRQVGSLQKAREIDPKSIGCSVGAIPNHYITGGYIFCTFDPGFYGRDHGDASGTPPDGLVKTCAGAYPAAGKLDNTPLANANFHEPIVREDGGNGAGIHPIFMSFFTDFMKAEIMARANDTQAKDQLLTAVQNSIDQVRDFATSTGQVLSPGREPDADEYIDKIDELYEAASNKLDVIGREYWVACWGNGIEAYNNYRRTSAPRNPQPMLQTEPGPFMRSIVYPSVFVNLNSNESVHQKDVNTTNKVFWDTNSDDLK
jgi:hypothetical protein